jgi:macrolide transport system ATP-binding/permease protein
MTLYLSINDITKAFGYHQVLNGASLTVNDGERIGLVGANGVGKSTLLKIVAGEIDADGGSITLSDSARIGYLEQEVLGADAMTIDDLIAESMRHVHDLEGRMRTLEGQMTASDGDDLDTIMREYGEVSEQFERAGGYAIDHQADAIFEGLAISHLPRERRYGTLSGGEKSRVGLATLLLQAPDILLLDEPTNHLDFASLQWLEDYLRAYRGGALIVSHDRQFLNRTANAIVEIDEHTRTAKRYTGDYDAYHAAKTMERRKWAQDYADQQEEIKALRQEIKVTARRNDNYRTHRDADKLVVNTKKATHAATISKRVRTAEERLKRIEADPIQQPPDDLQFRGDFDVAAFRGRSPLTVEHVSKAYGERIILDDVSFALNPRSRVTLVGPNGAGKSTLLRILMGQEAADAGAVTFNPGATVGYLDQEGDPFDLDQTVWEAFSGGLDQPEQHLKAILIASGLFRYDDLSKRVGEVSSGQRRKIQVARLIAGRANLLILDEPTNYVSFDVLEGLETALRDFPGPVIAASHDRRFMQQFGGEVWELRDGSIQRHLGGYAEYMGVMAAARS